MIILRGERATFSVRVAAVALDPAGKRVLIHRGPTDPFWTLPGGRVELMESAADALKREMLEELSVETTVERLLWIVDNFFVYEGKQRHEIAFYFLVSFPAGSPIFSYIEPFSGDEEGLELIYEWHDLATIEQANVLPSFLRSGLRAMPPATQYVVHVDE
jgi:ADP-ribose pyrophosphatase YjhB (NUDIX family)